MPKPKKIIPDQGWSWVILVSAFLCNVIFDGIIFSFGVFYMEFLDYFNEGRSKTSWIGSVISAVYALIGPLASILANMLGFRVVTMLGSSIASIGFIACIFAPNLAVMIVTYGILGGVGFGLMYLCCYVMIGHYFDKYRALATGISACGSGVGIFIFAPLSAVLIEGYGWKGGMLIIGGIVMNGLVIGATFRYLPTQDEGDDVKQKPKLLDFGLLKDPTFLIFCLSSFLCMIGFFVPFVYLPDFARKQDISREQGAFLLSIMGIFNTTGRICCGWLSDKSWADALKIYNAALIIGGGTTVVCSFFHSYVLLAIYAAIFGTCVASYVSLCAIILVEFLGLEKLSNSFGFLNMFRGISTFLGAPLAGFLFDTTGDYDVAFYVAGAFIAAAGIICLPLRMISRCSKNATDRNQDGSVCTEEKLDLRDTLTDSANVHTPRMTPRLGGLRREMLGGSGLRLDYGYTGSVQSLNNG